jgi:hypothetical protein
MELGPRDVVARANYNEIISTRYRTWWSLVRCNPFTKGSNSRKAYYYV